MLRELKEKDIPFMMEWMRDKQITDNFQKDFSLYTYDDILEFIRKRSHCERHFSIVDQNDIYMGTISLKNLSFTHKNAEYSIVTRTCAHGSGLAYEATKELLNYTFYNLNLSRIYLNVLEQNMRAISFYEKLGFTLEGIFRKHIYKNGMYQNLKWFGLLKDEYECMGDRKDGY